MIFFQRKRVNFSDPCLTSKKIFIKDDCEPSLEAKRLFDPDTNLGDDNLLNIFDPLTNETDNIDTVPSNLEVVNASLLRRDQPIYPKLIECKDDVMLILRKVTSPLFITTLLNKLKSKRIKTVGDLAVLSETEIGRLPFKVPVVANVYRALDGHYKKKYIKMIEKENDQLVMTNGYEELDVHLEHNTLKANVEELLQTEVRYFLIKHWLL